MAFEKRWAPIAVQSLTSDGTVDGQLKVADAFVWKVKQTLLLKSNSQNTLVLQVKRVVDPTTVLVGNPQKNIDDRTDVSAYTVADGASISSPDPHQVRPTIGPEEYWRAVYDEEPTVAVRSVLVDRGGRYIGSDPNSPFYVQLTDGSVNIGTVNAQLEMFLSHRDNDPDAGDHHSSVRIGDGTDELQINPDGSINTTPVPPSPSSQSVVSTYNEVASVPTATPTLLASYTAPVGKNTFFLKAFASGENIAKYQVKLNGAVIDTKRTYFSGEFNVEFDFSMNDRGLTLTVGDVVQVFVEHNRPDVGDFNARIQALEV